MKMQRETLVYSTLEKEGLAESWEEDGRKGHARGVQGRVKECMGGDFCILFLFLQYVMLIMVDMKRFPGALKRGPKSLI